MSAFSCFSLFWSYINPKWNPNTVNGSMGPVDLVTCINPKWAPNRNMVNGSMGPGDLVTCINPKRTPKSNMANYSMGLGGFVTRTNPKWNPNRNKVNFPNALMVAGLAPGVCPLGKPLVLWVKLPEGISHDSHPSAIFQGSTTILGELQYFTNLNSSLIQPPLLIFTILWSGWWF